MKILTDINRVYSDAMAFALRSDKNSRSTFLLYVRSPRNMPFFFNLPVIMHMQRPFFVPSSSTQHSNSLFVASKAHTQRAWSSILIKMIALVWRSRRLHGVCALRIHWSSFWTPLVLLFSVSRYIYNKLMKGKALRKQSLHEKTVASFLSCLSVVMNDATSLSFIVCNISIDKNATSKTTNSRR